VSQKAESLGAIGSWRLGAAQFAAVDRMQPFLSGEKSLNRKPRRIAAVDRHPLIPIPPAGGAEFVTAHGSDLIA